jgi:hypothetical protein
MQIGTGADEKKAVGTKVVRDVFFESLDFPRVTEERVIASAIAQGLKDGIFAYALKTKVLEEAGKYSVKEKDVIFGRTVSSDEIDLDSGFILLPECIIQETPPGPGPTPPGPTPPGPTPPGPTPPGPRPEPGKITTVRMDMKVNKQTLYKTFNALGNLADMAGEINMAVDAQSKDGFDRNRLRNAVKEPLEEAGIEIKISEE